LSLEGCLSAANPKGLGATRLKWTASHRFYYKLHELTILVCQRFITYTHPPLGYHHDTIDRSKTDHVTNNGDDKEANKADMKPVRVLRIELLDNAPQID
jgi:hypothetical protein